MLPNKNRSGRLPTAPWLYILPAIAFIGLFIYWPVVRTVYLSFLDWNLLRPERNFIGWDNYIHIFRFGDFLTALWNSVLYIVIALIGNFLLPVALALLTLQVTGRFADIYQSLLFVPTVISTVVATLIWQWMYLPTGGLINELIGLVGIHAQNWLNNPGTALGSIGVIGIWKFMGFNYLIALAGLNAVSREVLEAAFVDGTNAWSMVWKMILPMSAPTLLFIAITSVMQALPNVFVPIQIMTAGGPANASTNLVYDIYQYGFRTFQTGQASAESVLTLILLGGVAWAYFQSMDARTRYE